MPLHDRVADSAIVVFPPLLLLSVLPWLRSFVRRRNACVDATSALAQRLARPPGLSRRCDPGNAPCRPQYEWGRSGPVRSGGAQDTRQGRSARRRARTILCRVAIVSLVGQRPAGGYAYPVHRKAFRGQPACRRRVGYATVKILTVELRSIATDQVTSTATSA